MAAITYQLNAKTPPAPEVLLEKHFQRKHGPHAYYGQTAGNPQSAGVSGK